MSSRVGFRIYLISDGAEPARVDAALASLPAGAAAVQLRARGLDGRALHERALRLREAIAGRAPLLVNDRVDVALAAGADGAHLPARGLPSKVARRIAADLILGASTHSLPEARMAAAGGADFVTFGPVWRTRSHPGARPAGVAALAEVAAALAIPVFALGGVDPARAREALAAGARVATLGNLLGADDVPAAARAFAAALSA